jgi:hypothetical protein
VNAAIAHGDAAELIRFFRQFLRDQPPDRARSRCRTGSRSRPSRVRISDVPECIALIVCLVVAVFE